MSYYAKMLERISADPLQKAAYDTEDSTVVIAGPGSGKTTILLFKVLNRRSDRKSYTREGFIEMLKYYPLALPKIYVSLF